MEVELHSATLLITSSVNAAALVHAVLGLLSSRTIQYLWASLALASDSRATVLVGVLVEFLVDWASQNLLSLQAQALPLGASVGANVRPGVLAGTAFWFGLVNAAWAANRAAIHNILLESGWAIAWTATAVDWATIGFNRMCHKLAAFSAFWNQVLTLEHWTTVISQSQNRRSARWALLFTWLIVVIIDTNMFNWTSAFVLFVTLGVDSLDLLAT